MQLFQFLHIFLLFAPPGCLKWLQTQYKHRNESKNYVMTTCHHLVNDSLSDEFKLRRELRQDTHFPHMLQLLNTFNS